MNLNISTHEKPAFIAVEQVDGVAISVDRRDFNAAIAWLVWDKHEGPALYVYADVNSEEATHRIDLSEHFSSIK
jgi:hypothetical protein